jgi:hypothetical protein
VTSEKSCKYTDRIICAIRDESACIETYITATQNAFSTTQHEKEEKSAVLRAEQAFQKSLIKEIETSAKETGKLINLVARAQAAVDKKQNVIELRQKEKAEIGEREIDANGWTKKSASDI